MQTEFDLNQNDPLLYIFLVIVVLVFLWDLFGVVGRFVIVLTVLGLVVYGLYRLGLV